jgi:hypothetical protein
MLKCIAETNARHKQYHFENTFISVDCLDIVQYIINIKNILARICNYIVYKCVIAMFDNDNSLLL